MKKINTYRIKFLIDSYDTHLRMFKFFHLNFIPTANMFMVMQDGSKFWLDQEAEDVLIYMHRNDTFECRVKSTADMVEEFLVSQGWKDINEREEDNINVNCLITPISDDLVEQNDDTYQYQRPLIKWVGGKGRLLSVLLGKFINKGMISDGGKYLEPFIGGGAVALALNHDKMVLNDKNIKLMNFYEQVKIRPEKLHRKISKIIEQYNNSSEKESFYYDLRDKYNKTVLKKSFNGLSYAAWLWVLNKICFNGMYRETKSGDFNTPFGKRKCPKIDINDVLNISKILQNCELHHKQFNLICDMAKDGDLVYLDPPYIPLSPTASFSSYLRYGFGRNEHEKLAQSMAQMHDRGVKVIMSNSSSHLTKEIYGSLNGFQMHSIMINRFISGQSKGRSKVKELVITNVA